MRFKLSIVVISLCGLLSSNAFAADTYKFGVFPYLPPTKLNSLFSPITKDLSEALGKDIHLSSKPSYAEFSEQLSNEVFDIAFVQPFDYVTAHDKNNYLPLARRGEDLKAIIVVNKDSPLQTLQDLRGKIIANPPVSAAVTHLTSMALMGAGIDPDKDVTRDYGKSHFSCMQRVLIGSADACGTAGQALFHFEKKDMKGRFRVLQETQGIPHSLFVVHNRVPEAERAQLLERITGWKNSSSGREILSNGKFIPFVMAQDSDYDAVRKYAVSRQ